MATRPVVPRATGEGSIGTVAKHWGAGYFDGLNTDAVMPISTNNSVGATDRKWREGHFEKLVADDVIAKGPVVDVRAFGAKGDGVTDDTAAIQAAFNYGANKTIIFPAGTYIIDAETSIIGCSVKSNTKIVLSPSAIIKMRGNSHENYNVITIAGRENISITGGTISGEKDQHTGETGEGGIVIKVNNSKNIRIENCNICNGWGDGIIFGYGLPNDSNTVCKNIFVHNCNFYNNSRNDISVIGAQDVTITDSVFEGGNRINPKAGIDLEAEYEATINDGVVISGCIHHRSDNHGFIVSKYSDNVIVSNCSAKGNILVGTAMEGTLATRKLDNIIISDCNAKEIRLVNAKNSNLSNNTCARLYVGATHNSVVSGNAVASTYQRGMMLWNNINVTVESNIINGSYSEACLYAINDAGPNPPEYDIYKNIVKNNIFINNGNGSAILTTFGNFYSGNITKANTDVAYIVGGNYLSYFAESDKSFFGSVIPCRKYNLNDTFKYINSSNYIICTKGGYYGRNWRAGTEYFKSEIIVERGYAYKATFASASTNRGTSGGTKPTFNQTEGSETVDNDITWVNLGESAVFSQIPSKRVMNEIQFSIPHANSDSIQRYRYGNVVCISVTLTPQSNLDAYTHIFTVGENIGYVAKSDWLQINRDGYAINVESLTSGKTTTATVVYVIE